MARSYLTPINMNKLEITNLRLQQLASNPGSPVTGIIYYNTGDNSVRYYDGSTFQILSIGTADATTSSKGVIQLASTAFDAASTAAAPVLRHATASVEGSVQLAGDFAGSASSPLVANGAITNAKVSASAGIVYSKLSLATSIVVTDLAASATLNAIAGQNPTSADLNLNSHKLINVTDPSSAQDAATKNYVDNSVTGLDAKASVRAMTTANVTISNPGTAVFDGVTLSSGDRLLVPNQSAPAENGIYIFNGSGSALTRSTDMDSWLEVPSAYTWVESGTANADTGWISTADPGGTLGSTSITWSQFSASTTIQAGNGLQKIGNTMSILLDGAGITSGLAVSSSGIKVASLGITNAMIAASTIDLTTKVTGVLPIANGGTNANSAATARTNLSVPGVFTGVVTGDGSTTSFSFSPTPTNTGYVNVAVMDGTTGARVEPDITVNPSTNSTTIAFAVAPAIAATYKVIMVG